MKAVKKPIQIEVAVFSPHTKDLPAYVQWRSHEQAFTYAVINALHSSWIEVRPGDYLNVTDRTGYDIYPIDRETFERTYDVLP